jgi:hypothetical protein
MIQFVRDILLFVVLQLAVFGTLIGGFYRPAEINPIMASVNAKHERLASAPSPRMIFVGGSNVLFGIDGDVVRDTLGYEPVNMGLIAGLRLNYMLAEVEPHVRAGDVVVLALEFRQVFRRFEGQRSATVLAQMLEQRPGNVRYLEWSHVRELLDNGLVPQLGFATQQASKRLSRAVRFKPHSAPESYELNAWGDLVSHRDKPMRPNVLRERPLPRQVDVSSIGPSLTRINAFAAQCRARGAHVVFTWCPIPDVHHRRLLRPIATIDAALRAGLDVPILGSPDDFAYPKEAFFDSAFHLGSSEAIRDRTRRICEGVQASIGSAPSRRHSR